MTEEDKAEVRALALDVIRDYRDRGCPEPEPLPAELVHEMMAWLVCEDVPGRVRPDAHGGDGARRRRRPARSSSAGDAAARDAFPVVVIGCGQSGLLAGIRLGEAGIPYTIVEKNAGVGGTWWENSYPGARVDVGNHFYCYSFEPSDHWTEFFAQQPELQAYFDGVMRKYGVDRHVRWETEVLGADVGRRCRRRGRSACARADGTEETLVARAVISAVGQLNRPNLPDIPGPRLVRRSGVPLRALGPRRRPRGQARRDDRRRRERVPDRADDRARRRAAHGVPAHRAVDVPEPELPRAGRPGRAVGAAPPPVLRPVVPVPDLLARLRQGARGGACRPRLPRSADRGERDERPHPPDVHRLDREPGRRRSRS